MPYLIDPYEQTTDTFSQVCQKRTDDDVYKVHCCPGSRRAHPVGDGQFGSLGAEGVTVVVVTCLIVGFVLVMVVTVGFLISGFGASCAWDVISGVFARQGHSGHCVPVHTIALPLQRSEEGQLADAQLNSVNVASPSNVPSLHVLTSEVQFCSPVFDEKNALEVPLAKIKPFNSQFAGSWRIHVFDGRGS